MFNSPIVAEPYETREPEELDLFQGQQGSEASQVTKPVRRSTEPRQTKSRQSADDSSLRTALLVDSDSATSSTRVFLLSEFNVTVTPVTGYAEVFSTLEHCRYSLVAISMKAGFEEVRNTAVHVRKSWPDTKILLLGTSTLDLDDPLYDDIVDPAFHPAALVRSVLQLLALSAHRGAD